MAKEFARRLHPPPSLLLRNAQREAQKAAPSSHTLGPYSMSRRPPGAPLSSAANSRNFNRTRKAALARMGKPEAHRNSPHAFRRGATQEMEESGPPSVSSGVIGNLSFRCVPGLHGYVPRCRIGGSTAVRRGSRFRIGSLGGA